MVRLTDAQVKQMDCGGKGGTKIIQKFVNEAIEKKIEHEKILKYKAIEAVEDYYNVAIKDCVYRKRTSYFSSDIGDNTFVERCIKDNCDCKGKKCDWVISKIECVTVTGENVAEKSFERN